MGQHAVEADYSDSANGNFGASSGTLTETILFSTSTSLTSSLNPTVYGQSTPTFTATITTANGGTPTGSVTFFDGAVTLATTPLVSGVATFTPASNTTLPIGSDVINAVYSGDATFASSNMTLTQVVLSQTTTTLSTTGSPSVYGQPGAIQATVAPVSPGTGTPDGTVTFFINGVAQSPDVALVNGVASFDLSTLAASSTTYTFTANYNGDGSTYNGSAGSNSVSQTVNPANTTTTVTSAVNPAGLNQAVTFTATVVSMSPSTAVPVGTVTFIVDGKPLNQTVTLGSNGQATLSQPFTSLGNHTVSAQYNPTANFLSNPSNTITESVLKASTTTLRASANPAVPGSVLTLTATVRAAVAGNPQPGGSVTFYIDGIADRTSTLSSLGVATDTLVAGSGLLTTGTHTIVAVYSGNNTGNVATSYAPSSSTPLNEGVHYQSKTTLTSSANPLTVGNTVTFTATVNPVLPGTGTLTGSVIFYINGVQVANQPLIDGVATYQTSSLASGPNGQVASYTVKAVYSPDTTLFATSSATLTQKVQPIASRLVASVSPNPPSVNSAFAVNVVAYNAQGKVATGLNGTGTIAVIKAPSGGQIVPIGGSTVSVTFTQGRLHVSGLSATIAGRYTLQIAVDGLVVDLSIYASGRQV